MKIQKIALEEIPDLLGERMVDGLLALIVLDQGTSSFGQQDIDDFDSASSEGPNQSFLVINGLVSDLPFSSKLVQDNLQRRRENLQKIGVNVRGYLRFCSQGSCELIRRFPSRGHHQGS